MLQLPQMLMIGAAGRKVGKTELACALVRRFCRAHRIVAVKVTVVRRGQASCPRGGKGCGICSSFEGPFCLTDETHGPPGKDTTRLAEAGAKTVYWLRVFEDHLPVGMAALLERMGRQALSICESTRLRLAVQPGVFLLARRAGGHQPKPWARKVQDYVDRVVTFDGTGFDLDLARLTVVDGAWGLREAATAIVLAGGSSRRMGIDKSMLAVDGRPLIEHICRQLRPHFDQVLISADDREKYAFLNLPVIPDMHKDRGPLAGIASAVQASSHDLNFVVACDIPDIPMPLVRRMLREAQDHQVVVPQTDRQRYEPLFAVYTKAALPAIHEVLAASENKIDRIFPLCRTRYLPLSPSQRLRNLNSMRQYEDYLSERKQAVALPIP